ncbi:MAG TPA: hypothetical protein VHW24_09540 [Bryobacteraceae bacterium]|jgi:hypothetical protein|nr:hypothetical protein [Bryobacteraceae bacterium]
MPVSFEFLRGIAGIIGIGCAYLTGRAFVLTRKGLQKQSRFFGWVFRTVLCMIAVGLRHALDLSSIIIWIFAALAFGLAIWQFSREKKEEDLTRTMFPGDEE